VQHLSSKFLCVILGLHFNCHRQLNILHLIVVTVIITVIIIITLITELFNVRPTCENCEKYTDKIINVHLAIHQQVCRCILSTVFTL